MELLEFMQKYIQIDTSHPKPDYDQAFRFFEKQAIQDGFKCKLVPLKSGLRVMIISFEAKNEKLPAIALNHHVDVVPVDEALWTVPAFEGIIENDLLYGRGTQDMKGVGVCHYFALRKLKQKKANLKRSIHLILLPHEEVGGFAGGGFFVNTKEFEDLNIGFVLDEGLPSGSDKGLFIKVSERKPMQISFVCSGKMAHGSRLMTCNAIHDLSQFLSRIRKEQDKQRNLAKKEHPGLLLSMNATSFQAGIVKNGNVALNIVPGTAQATVDVRVPPTMKKCDALGKIQAIMNDFPNISYEIKTQAGERPFNPDYKNDFYCLLEKIIKANNIGVKSYFAEESSDMRFYLEKGITGLGLTPFTIEENLHGIDEAIKVNDLVLGTDIFYDFIKSFCT